jgi:hypothetical protein
VESAAAIERAFAAKRVDLTITGDWNEVQVDLGLKTRAEIRQMQRNVDAEHFSTLVAKHPPAPSGFGTAKPSAKKTKDKKKKK